METRLVVIVIFDVVVVTGALGSDADVVDEDSGDGEGDEWVRGEGECGDGACEEEAERGNE